MENEAKIAKEKEFTECLKNPQNYNSNAPNFFFANGNRTLMPPIFGGEAGEIGLGDFPNLVRHPVSYLRIQMRFFCWCSFRKQDVLCV